MNNLVFIIGSARSGTTVLGKILDCHDKVMQWYEPYYLWRKYFTCKENEIWMPEELNGRVKNAIQKEHLVFQQKSRKSLIVEKMPSHSFNIKLINEIFPEAKWIHIIRDGRDVTLSMKKEWQKREKIIRDKDFFNSFKTALKVLQRAPFFRYKIMLLMYEFNSNASIRPSKYLNKAKWEGNIGWGPRFEGWQDFLNTHTSIEFNATQWVKSVEAVKNDWDILNDKNKIEIRYEDLLMSPENSITDLTHFLGIDLDSKFFRSIPKINTSNFNKWKNELNPQEIKKIQPILNNWLIKLGYIQQAN